MMNVIMLSVNMLNVIMLSVKMLNVIMLSVNMLNVIAPSQSSNRHNRNSFQFETASIFPYEQHPWNNDGVEASSNICGLYYKHILTIVSDDRK